MLPPVVVVQAEVEPAASASRASAERQGLRPRVARRAAVASREAALRGAERRVKLPQAREHQGRSADARMPAAHRAGVARGEPPASEASAPQPAVPPDEAGMLVAVALRALLQPEPRAASAAA